MSLLGLVMVWPGPEVLREPDKPPLNYGVQMYAIHLIFGHLSNFWIRTQTLRTTYLPSQLFPFESIVASDQLRRVGIRPRTWFGSVMAQTSGLRRDPSRSDSEQLSHWRIRFRFAIS